MKQKKKIASLSKNIDSDSDNLEAENIELLNKLQAQEVQLNQLRSKLSSAQPEDSTLMTELMKQL